MTFDIRQLDKVDYDGDNEEALETYQNAVLDLFYQSPEGQGYVEAHPDIEVGFWITQLIYYGFVYESATLPRMTAREVENLVTDIFPRKITLFSKEEAADTIPELIAFWQFLKRVYALPKADEIIRFLQMVEPNFGALMMDSSKFGMAKSIMMRGNSAGYDMRDEAEMNEFIATYNAGIAAQGRGSLPQPDPSALFDLLAEGPSSDASKSSVDSAKKKKKRKMAKASRKQNRKKRK
jgi:hypothetical protein